MAIKSKARRNFELAARDGQYARKVLGLMARDDGGSFTTAVPGRPDFVYMRAWQGGVVSLSMTLNPNSVTTTGDTPIDVDVLRDGGLIADKLRYTGN